MHLREFALRYLGRFRQTQRHSLDAFNSVNGRALNFLQACVGRFPLRSTPFIVQMPIGINGSRSK